MERVGEGRDAITRKAVDHPLYRVLHDQPNSWMGADELWGMSVAHDSLRGDFLAFKTVVRGEVRELLPIDPSRVVEIRQNPDWTITYIISTEGTNREYREDAIFHVRGMSLNGYSGLNPIAYNREAIGVGIASEKFKAKYFGQGMNPGAIITLPPEERLNTEDTIRFREALNVAYAGLNKSREAMVLKNGSTINFPQIKLVDQQFLENEKFTQSQIASIFRVPLMLLQAGDNPESYASSENFMLAFVTHALTPLIVNREKAIYRSLLSPEDRKRYYAKFNMAGLLRGDMKSRYEAYQIGINAEILNPNNCREWEDLNPYYPGGEEYRSRTSTIKQPEKTVDSNEGSGNE
jgi:HK97 family phage portal protein